MEFISKSELWKLFQVKLDNKTEENYIECPNFMIQMISNCLNANLNMIGVQIGNVDTRFAKFR